MTQTRLRRRLGAPVLLALLVLAAGCADPSSDPRTAGAATASARAKGLCPPPEDTLASPSPCITSDWDQRVAENHAYRQARSLTAEQREVAQPRATALAEVLRRLVAKGTTPDGLRTAAAEALGLEARQIEVQGEVRVPLHDMLVGGGEGPVCVNGTIDSSGHATAEVVGRTLDGACLPGLGGH
ncbi:MULTISPECIES: precorrin-3B C(17)-methyltransferase [unclassified Streptomyces]|uniref:precorrin-3B C(17)-methyltransferase n=1 Tax=unclassified Streptomyces TaxID=2593676 RepID=UPI0038005F0F